MAEVEPADGALAEALAVLRERFGPVLSIAPLGGMSFSHVYRLRFAHESVVIKFDPRPTEVAFYQRVAPRVQSVGVETPRCELLSLPSGRTLLLEDVPKPRAPFGTQLPDERMLHALVRLHAASRTWRFKLPPAAVVRWDAALTTDALCHFSPAVAPALGRSLMAMQERSAHLDRGWCWISGDPNPLNWGERADGSLVLFDWELFRRGLPATDLAIIVGGLGDANAFADLAERYRAAWPAETKALPWDVRALARDIALAKVRTVVDVLARAARGTLQPTAGLIPRLVELVPDWVAALPEAA